MSTLSQYGSGIKSIQTGFVGTTTVSTGTGEALRYVDITVSAVSNISKCFVVFNGSANNQVSDTNSWYYSGTISGTFLIPTIRVLNSTTVRIMSSSSSILASGFVGRWTLVEYN
jgi:hypothetical protein